MRGAALREGSPPTVFVAGDGDVVHRAQLEAGAGEDLQLHGTQHTRLDICREHTRQASRRTSYESPEESTQPLVIYLGKATLFM